MEKTIDRTCYRRVKFEERKVNKNKRKMITIFYNEVIITLGIILLLLVVKIYDYRYFEIAKDWYEKAFESGIQFEKIEKYFLDKYENLFSSTGKKNEKEIISNLYLVNDSLMANEKELDTIDLFREKYKLIKPVEGIITSSFGIRESNSSIVSENHKGVDVAASKGTDIIASHDGKVIYADNLDSYGLCVVIEYENLKTVYAHCSNILAKKGAQVKCGEKIAEVGMTGNATGNHLHFEVRYNNEYLDPEEIIKW